VPSSLSALGKFFPSLRTELVPLVVEFAPNVSTACVVTDSAKSRYRQFETARRVSLFYMASLLASGFGPIFAYALSLIRVGDGMYRAGWR
jgi:hypothetical protein